MTRLPQKLSDLLELALNDLQTCEKDRRYSINMCAWHRPNDAQTVCEVCLAGSVIARRILKGQGSGNYQSPYSLLASRAISELTHKKLLALNALRTGSVRGAFHLLGKRIPKGLSEYEGIARYSADRAQFYSQLRSLVRRLRKHAR